jgi:hypothetical protein
MDALTKTYQTSNSFTPFPNLKGISPGVEKPKVEKKVEKSTLEKLLEVYEEVKRKYKFSDFLFDDEDNIKVIYTVEDKLKSLLSEINYSEKDISNLVATAQMRDEDEFLAAFGAYVGSLITFLTERNEAKGKRTIIEIDENRLDYLGCFCRKFDTVKFGVNNGNHVFMLAKNGNELYVERCEGNEFASYAGWGVGYVGEISAGTVKGASFASFAGSDGGYVGEIKANIIKGSYFAESAGSKGGHVVEISADTVIGKGFAYLAGWFGGHVGEISADTVNEDEFASGAGSGGGRVGKISAGTVNGKDFADRAGVSGGYIDEISVDTVNGARFAFDAVAEKIYVRKISEKAKATMNPKTIIGDWEVEK